MKNSVYLLVISALSILIYYLLGFMSQHSILLCPVRGFDIFIILVPALFALFHFMLVSQLKDEKKFVRRFMLLLTMKFISLLVVLLIGLLLNRENPRCFVLTFLLVYLPFMIFETLVLMKMIGKK
mgnify:CR=1 FL=1